MRRFVSAAAIAALFLSCSAGQSLLSAAADDGLFDNPVLAKGKGFEIRRTDLENAFIGFKSNAAALGEAVPEDKRETLEAELLNELILTKILVQMSTEADKQTAQKSAAELVRKIKERSSSEASYKLRLRALGLKAEDFENQVYEQELRKTILQREVAAKIPVTDDEIKKVYTENPNDFDKPEYVRAAHVLISTVDKETKQPLPPEKKKQKEEIAKKVKARADAGEDFAKLALEFSEDPNSKDKGGEYTFGRGDMVKSFEVAAFGLNTNEISGVVETQYGYHIIKLLEKHPARKESLEEASPRIKDYLVAKEIGKRLPDYYAKLKKGANAEILDAKLRSGVEELEAKAAAQPPADKPVAP